MVGVLVGLLVGATDGTSELNDGLELGAVGSMEVDGRCDGSTLPLGRGVMEGSIDGVAVVGTDDTDGKRDTDGRELGVSEGMGVDGASEVDGVRDGAVVGGSCSVASSAEVFSLVSDRAKGLPAPSCHSATIPIPTPRAKTVIPQMNMREILRRR